MTMGLRLSALDLVPIVSGGTSATALRASEDLAAALDRAGYSRLWYAEHHNMPGIGATTPELLIAHIAPRTSRIRLGAGGVMLPNHAPLAVAESYRLLEAMHPGRIDLGLGRAPGTDPLTALALRRSQKAVASDDFLSLLGELMSFDDGEWPDEHPFRVIRAMPDDVRLPPLWLLGSSDYSAKLAAKLGLGFAFAGHFSLEAPDHSLRLYRNGFTKGVSLPEPNAILALSVFCADTEEAARRMASSMMLAFAQLRTGKPARLASPDEALAHDYTHEERAVVDAYRKLQIVGTPETVRARIEEIATRTGADEVMIATHAWDPAARIRSFELVGEAFGLLSSSAS